MGVRSAAPLSTRATPSMATPPSSTFLTASASEPALLEMLPGTRLTVFFVMTSGDVEVPELDSSGAADACTGGNLRYARYTVCEKGEIYVFGCIRSKCSGENALRMVPCVVRPEAET